MGWLDKAKGLLDSAKGELGKLMGAGTIDGVGAALALVGMANGQIKSEEEAALISEISASDALGKWAPEIVKAFQKHVQKLKSGSLASKAEVLTALNKVPAGSAAANVTIATCISIAGSDQDFDDEEKKVVKDIAGRINADITPYSDLFTA